ncbi:Cytochrome c oxidase subunit 6A, mitochondrial [Lunasporangiospora selenospora]|uniref:Cytochrome c oxidase subunit 6A, mitochondrial n=1 Tax=Lunasporangiospora selenospora TaxID=979761 RepID=A0A9P6FZC3_9FUNG|nr:Cytochrome c oxidase subunit 6A, mitochondrial [Lunasporangiospora selenospora]
MASRFASAAFKGARFSSSSTAVNTASNPWLAERIAIKEHAGPAAETWRKISLYVCIPALIATTVNAYNLFAKHQAHIEHDKAEGHVPVKYPYMRWRVKEFPWGDEALFYNPDINF